MFPIEIIGAGPGDEALLTGQAREALLAADAVFAVERHAVLRGGNVRPLVPFEAALSEMAALREEGKRLAVLVSGDPGLYSLLGLLGRRFGRDALRVLPGISTLQAFAAAMGRPWQGAGICSAHGRALSPSALCHAVRTNRETYFFLDAERSPRWVRAMLDAGGLAHVRLTVGERLSYPDGRAEPYDPARDYPALCMAFAENDCPEAGLPPIGLPDDAFIRGKTPMTKREIRVQALAALNLAPDAVVWDVGAGTGSVSVECARQCPLGSVYAVERDADALSLIGQNRDAFHLLNLSVVPGSAPGALADLPMPTHVFLGGTGRQARAILDMLYERDTKIRVVATAVTMESAGELLSLMRGLSDFSAAQISVSRLEGVGSYTMLRAQNPVFLFAGTITKEQV